MNFIVLSGALNLMQTGPRPIDTALRMSAELNRYDTFDAAALWAYFESAATSDESTTIFRQALAKWDNEADAPWIAGTERNTIQRRSLIYNSLDLNTTARDLCERRFPFRALEEAVVIAVKHAIWYTDEIRQARDFYWRGYKRQLLEVHGWKEESVMQLDESATRVVERLGNPSSGATYQSKGLVIGYVQSGKTSNFTGVIAKSADAGYKFFIVLAGTLDVLRTQTQRRIDKDMIGRELLAGDYSTDADIDDFVSHGARPSELGSFDWYRLTEPRSDYKRLRTGIHTLAFDYADLSKPFLHPDNLFRARTKIAIVKKNSTVLKRLIADLEHVKKHKLGCPLDQVPTLIIDDESDQASINTKKPVNSDDSVSPEERTATNKAITDLLKLLPRSQYVGYTATPFANVFIDPNNEEDIFPKDFLISLPRPADYMGVSDFYDLDGSVEMEGSRPNHRDFVREVTGADDDLKNLVKAIDCFVLSGALKLFRTHANPNIKFKHHTMLAHASSKVVEHQQLRDLVQKLFDNAGYDGGPGLERLQILFNDDFLPVTKRRQPELPMPSSFADLTSAIGGCLSKVRSVTARAEGGGRDSGSVLILNSATPDEAPDFDRQEIWKILVGGTKLSRGYTVEGLTISYYRRRTGTADTLMQMGRWFGYRPYFGDLVRLFIGTKEPLDKKGRRTINLYEAFGNVCRDEEMFREEITRYANLEKHITPRDVPPLVPSHMRMLKPTAKNKMYNAVIQFRNFGGKLSESTLAPFIEKDIKKNKDSFDRLLKGVDIKSETLSARRNDRTIELSAKTAKLDPARVIQFLQEYAWKDGDPMVLEAEFLKGTGNRSPAIDNWILLAPQIPDATGKKIEINGDNFYVVYRSREAGDPKARFNTYNDPKHRAFAELIAGIAVEKPLTEPSDNLSRLCRPKQAVMIYYPITENENKAKPPYTTGFTLFFPPNNIPTLIKFGVRRSDKPDAITVTVPKSGA